MWERSELKARGKNVLNATYWTSVLVCFILGAISGAGVGGSGGSSSSSDGDSLANEINGLASSLSAGEILAVAGIIFAVITAAAILGFLIRTFVGNPVEVGGMRYFMESRERKSSVGVLGYSFKNGYANITLTMFLRGLYISLWSLLLVIPGIIKSYEYRMIPYILAENPQISHKDAFRLSREMMNGEKWNAFVLDLSFLLWFLLGVCTCGIALVFYVTPYVQHTNAELYAVLREKVLSNGISNTYELKGFGGKDSVVV